jgi:hypothetical protein
VKCTPDEEDNKRLALFAAAIKDKKTRVPSVMGLEIVNLV